MNGPTANQPLYDIYRTDGDAIRYALGRSGQFPLFIIALNPSTATQYRRDQTLTRIERFALRRANSTAKAQQALILCNLYPKRATDPNALPSKPDLDLIKQNTRQISSLVQCAKSPEIWAAWGDSIEKRPYLMESLRHLHLALSPHSPRWLRCGPLTHKGHPRHPSRLSYKSRFHPLDLETYLFSGFHSTHTLY